MLPIRDQIKKTTYNSEFIEKAEERWRASEGERKKEQHELLHTKRKTQLAKNLHTFFQK